LNIAGPGMFLQWIDTQPFHALHPKSGIIAAVSVVWLLISLGLAWFLFTYHKAEFHESFSLDRIYDKLFVTSFLRLSSSLSKVDSHVIDGIVHGFVYTQVIIAKTSGYFDRYIVDGSVSAVAWISRATGNLLRGGTGGRVQSYLTWSAIALIIFIFWLFK